ncbi:uncharacterized protein [Physcomitrium patens]|uniref:uncharacterized protein isoform X3 n=1 Tax=Physcomitrium patens TaxID=3218 RepID=UPI003CCDD22F
MISLAEPKRIWKAASSATVTSKCANEPTPDQEVWYALHAHARLRDTAFQQESVRSGIEGLAIMTSVHLEVECIF